jgi:rubrerythrin
MNILNIIDTIEKVDPEIYDRLDSRRSVFGKASKFAGKVAIAAIPFAFGDMFKQAYGKTNATVTDVLNFALTLEYLEAEFYNIGVAATGLIPASDMAIFKQIAQHENAHVKFLKAALGTNAIAKPRFDFTGGKGNPGGPFPDYATNYQTYLKLSQGFEDTGVRAYKGQAGNLMSAPDVLTAALQIHAVEARHASEVRRLRLQKGWITGNQTDVTLLAPVYAGEDNTTQGGVALTYPSNTNAVSEAFDEPLDMASVNNIAGLFIY